MEIFPQQHTNNNTLLQNLARSNRIKRQKITYNKKAGMPYLLSAMQSNHIAVAHEAGIDSGGQKLQIGLARS